MIKKMKQDGELLDLFIKKEECDPILLDKYGRFFYYLSSKINIFEPEVSNFLIKNELNSEYPEGRNLLHALPIDFVYSGVLNAAARTVKALKGDKFAKALGLPFSRINKTWSPCGILDKL
jgi:hypothetical protein